MAEHVHSYLDGGEIERRDTGLRIALTVLFVIVDRVLGAAEAVIVIFSLLVALVTRQPPARSLRELANRIIVYRYRIARYLTYNESRVPFPFSDFPPALEPDEFRAEDTESESIGWPKPRDRDR